MNPFQRVLAFSPQFIAGYFMVVWTYVYTVAPCKGEGNKKIWLPSPCKGEEEPDFF